MLGEAETDVSPCVLEAEFNRMSFEVRDKVALVTGSNRGIGRAIVDSLLAHGAAKVYAAVRNLASVAELAATADGRVVPLMLDLSDVSTVAAAATVANDVELVINNAGVLKVTGPLEPTALAALDYEIDVNVKGLLRVAQAFASVLAFNGGGAFVQLNSVVSVKSFSNFATYSASKAAAYSLTQALRDALAGQGTHVMSVHPGPIATDMGNEAGLGDIAEPPEVVAEAIIAGLKSGQFHVFPDSMAKQIWEAYAGFARTVIEAEFGEGG